jgi:hypothetical protein
LRKVAVIVIAAAVTGLVVGIVVANSGDGDDSPSRDVRVPELKPPPGSSGDQSQSETGDEGTNGGSTPDQGTGGTQQPAEPDTGGSQPPPDTEQNDQPPPKGSPAERFERFCQENPGAC